MNGKKEINIPEILKDRGRVQKALRDAVQKAIRFHKLMGRFRPKRSSCWMSRPPTAPQIRTDPV
jgi:hypothetical protein